jgi:3-oxoacyl-[acyl-carrier protein] reductase
MQLDKAVALVTGGSSGIGFATAHKLIAAGARVAICGRDEKKLARAADDLGALPVHADISVESDVVAAVRRVVDELGDYNVLVNNAGFGSFAPLLETSLEEMQRVYATNVFGAMLAARESARHFVARQYGNIVNVASTAAQRGFAGGTAYASSKFALHGLTECWRAELRTSNVRVMQINPSEVQTAFYRGRGYNPRKLHAEDVADAIAAMLAMDDRGFVPEMAVWATNPQD